MANPAVPGGAPQGNEVGFTQKIKQGIGNAVDRITGADRRNMQVDQAYRDANRQINPEQIQRFRNADEIVQFVERQDNRRFRERNLEKKYGKGALAEFKKYLAGEYDFNVDQNGEIKRNAFNEMSRKAFISVFNRRNVVGAIGMGAIGLLTGGVGLAASGALLGAAGGRAAAEAWEMFKGEERKLREQIAVLEFEHAQAMKDLAQKRRELMGQGNNEEANKILHQVVDLFYTESEDLVQTRSRLASTKEQWDRRRETLTMIGGLTGSAIGIYGGMAHWGETATNAKSALTNAKIDLDGNGVYHNVEKVNGTWHYLYNDAKELATAKAMAAHKGWDLTVTPLSGGPGHILPGVTDQMIKNAMQHHGQTGLSGVINTLQSLNPLWKEIGQSAAVLGAAFLAGRDKGQTSELDKSFEEIEKKRIKGNLPPLSTVNNEVQQSEEKNKPAVNQFWTFPVVSHYFVNPNFNQIENAFIEVPNPLDGNNPNHINFGTYRIERMDGDNVTLILMGNANPTQPFATANNENRRIVLSKKDLQNYGQMDQEGIGKRGYQKNYEVLAQYLGNKMPAKNDIWVFSQYQFNSAINPANNIYISNGAKARWRVFGINNNQVMLARVGDTDNRPVTPEQKFDIHVVDMLYQAHPERTEHDIEADNEILQRLGIDPVNIGDKRFRSPVAAGLTDNYGNAINQNIECKVSSIDVQKGLISLEAVQAINRIKPKYIVKISDLVGTNPWQPLASPEKNETDATGESKEKSKNSFDRLREILVEKGMIGADQQKEIAINRSIFYDSNNNMFVIFRFVPDVNDDNAGVIKLLPVTQSNNNFRVNNNIASIVELNVDDFIAGYEYFKSDVKLQK